MAQIAGLTAMSFGQEDIDRYIVVYKKDHAPSEDEIFARRNGEEWNSVTAEKYAQMVSIYTDCDAIKMVSIEFFICLLL